MKIAVFKALDSDTGKTVLLYQHAIKVKNGVQNRINAGRYRHPSDRTGDNLPMFMGWVDEVVEHRRPEPVPITVYARSYAGKLRCMEVVRAKTNAGIFYVTSDSGKRYMVKHIVTSVGRGGSTETWVCNCPHFYIRCLGTRHTCHHIDGVVESESE